MQRKTKQNLVKNVEEMEGKLSGIQNCQQKKQQLYLRNLLRKKKIF